MDKYRITIEIENETGDKYQPYIEIYQQIVEADETLPTAILKTVIEIMGHTPAKTGNSTKIYPHNSTVVSGFDKTIAYNCTKGN